MRTEPQLGVMMSSCCHSQWMMILCNCKTKKANSETQTFSYQQVKCIRCCRRYGGIALLLLHVNRNVENDAFVRGRTIRKSSMRRSINFSFLCPINSHIKNQTKSTSYRSNHIMSKLVQILSRSLPALSIACSKSLVLPLSTFSRSVTRPLSTLGDRLKSKVREPMYLKTCQISHSQSLSTSKPCFFLPQ